MSGDRSNVFQSYPEQLALPNGVTAAILPMPNQLGFILKYVSGGSLSLIGYSSVNGTTFDMSNIYTVGTAEVINISQSSTLFLIGTGATCVAQMIRLRGAGATFV